MATMAQRSFQDLSAPLADVPFCVLDIETTGSAPGDLGITEIAAIRYLGGCETGRFQTLVDPGLPIPPFITVLTGITHALLVGSPKLAEAFPSFLEFLGDAVVVGHNVRFDMSHLQAASVAHGYGRIPNRTVDTLGMARRLLAGEVRTMKLGALAAYLRSPVTPTHRALADAEATAHVFWELLGRAGAIGITHLDDLLAMPTARGKADYRKIALTDRLPRRPGVYLFRDRKGEVFYVGKALDIRSRVRSYFYGDDRRSVAQMLRELDAVDHQVCANEIEAEVTEIRLIAEHRPRHNRRSKPPRSPHFVRLTAEEFPRLSLARTIAPGALLHLGPFRSAATGRAVIEALWDATRIRRCSHPPGSRTGPCSFAQLGLSLCPCDGTLPADRYRPVVTGLIRGVTEDPSLLLDPLEARISSLARQRRFEEAAWVRDRHRALATAIERRRAWRSMQHAGLMRAEGPAGGAIIDHGHLAGAWAPGDGLPLPTMAAGIAPTEIPRTTTEAEEAHLLWRWLYSGGVRLADASASLSLPARPVPGLTRIAV